MSDATLNELAVRLGRDASTLSSAVKRFDRRCYNKPELKEKIEQLKREVEVAVSQACPTTLYYSTLYAFMILRRGRDDYISGNKGKLQAVQPGKPEERLLFLEQITRADDKTQIFLHDIVYKSQFFL